MENFKKKNFFKLSKMDSKEKLEYYYNLKDSMLANDTILGNVSRKKKMHIYLLSLIKLLRKLNGHKLEVIGEIPKTDKPVIIAFTHICKWDIERIAEAVKMHFYIFSGDPEHTIGVFPDYQFMNLNGTIFCDNTNMNDNSMSLKVAIDGISKHKINILWSVEGIWNISQNQLMYELYKGPFMASLLTNSLILPVAIDQEGKKFTVNIGEFIDPEKYLNDQNFPKLKNKVSVYKDELRNTLATLKMEMILNKEVTSRENFKHEDIEMEIDNILNEWVDKNNNPIYTRNIVDERRLKAPGIEKEYVKQFGHLFKNNKNYQ